jgi:transcriptional accessory protein Tex/SPT6
VRSGDNILDSTALHPDSYPIVEKMAASLGVPVAQLIGNNELLSALNLADFVTESAGPVTLREIREELLKPGRDPRSTFAAPKFRADIKDIGDLKEGMVLEGTVTNVTNFGAFVDVGVHQDGLVHLSQMSTRFIRDPREAVKVGDVVQVKVISVEIDTKRIGLSMKALSPAPVRRKKRPRRRPAATQVPAAAENVPAEINAIPASPGGSSSTGPASENAPLRRSQGEQRNRFKPRRREERGEHKTPRKFEKPQVQEKKKEDDKPRLPEPSLQEKIAILQSKFRGIN